MKLRKKNVCVCVCVRSPSGRAVREIEAQLLVFMRQRCVLILQRTVFLQNDHNVRTPPAQETLFFYVGTDNSRSRVAQ